jgi:DNA-binding CsgD family transcriptional regulator
MLEPPVIGPHREGLETPLGLLSPVELRILCLVSQNKTSKSIAQELHASYRTVQNHRFRMCRKLGLAGYNELFRFALEHKSALQLFPPATSADATSPLWTNTHAK